MGKSSQEDIKNSPKFWHCKVILGGLIIYMSCLKLCKNYTRNLKDKRKSSHVLIESQKTDYAT